jgi:hypothetical protein
MKPGSRHSPSSSDEAYRPPSAITGVGVSYGDNHVYPDRTARVGRLACKNSVLIVKFTREIEARCRGTVAAAVDAAWPRPSPDSDDVLCFVLLVASSPLVRRCAMPWVSSRFAGCLASYSLACPSPRLLGSAAKLRGTHQTERGSSGGV